MPPEVTAETAPLASDRPKAEQVDPRGTAVAQPIDCRVIPPAVSWHVTSVEKIVAAMRESPRAIRYGDLFKVCEHYFGAPRRSAGSHAVFKAPWPGDPRVNIQNGKGNAKAYQVRQVLAAIDKKEAM